MQGDMKVYDEALALQRSGGRRELAAQMFEMLRNTLPATRQAIQTAAQDADRQALLTHVHKLNGATRYCGVPALGDAAQRLEQCLKNGECVDVDTLLIRLDEAIERVLALP